MAIKFGETFGAGSNNAGGASGNRSDQPKAKVWLNIGYLLTDVPTSDGTGVEDRFVSLPVGIPLDTMELLDTTMKNKHFAMFQAARNGLHAKIMQVAEALAPGESSLIGDSSGVCIQVRRVDDERVPITSDESNPFVVDLEIKVS